MYVLKNKNGAFVNQNSINSHELNYVFTSIETTQHYTESEVRRLRERFQGTWREQKIKVFEIEYQLKEVNL